MRRELICILLGVFAAIVANASGFFTASLIAPPAERRTLAYIQGVKGITPSIGDFQQLSAPLTALAIGLLSAFLTYVIVKKATR